MQSNFHQKVLKSYTTEKYPGRPDSFQCTFIHDPFPLTPQTPCKTGANNNLQERLSLKKLAQGHKVIERNELKLRQYLGNHRLGDNNCNSFIFQALQCSYS